MTQKEINKLEKENKKIEKYFEAFLTPLGFAYLNTYVQNEIELNSLDNK